MRIVSLNIRHGGGNRISRLADWIETIDPSVVVIPEWRNNGSGKILRDRLTEAGFRTVATARATTKINSVLLAAIGLTESREVTPPTSPAGDLILIDLIQGVQILGCYFPQRKTKASFFQQCIHLAQENPDVPFVMIGDLNTGRNDLDIEGTGTRFDCADLFEALNREAGLIDLWRARYGDQQEWTWRSSANGFRIDHAFGNKAFINRFPAFRCVIDHAPRLSGLTDHSAVVLEFD
jgi:exonuclease III